jgi:predicted Ser/Thr protein kinase
VTPTQQERVRDLFEQAIDRDLSTVAAWVAAEAADDPAVRDEVLALLAHHARAGEFLSQAIVERIPSLLEDQPYAAGAVVGPYVIERELGRGGMGRVYLARDDRLDRTVALKLLAPALVGDPAQRERLRREARAAAALTHPGICKVYSLDEIDGELAIACEFVDGVTLREEIATGSRPAADAVRTARELATALASAHARGIVHRDLKPENIMRTRDGRLKILDFGLAQIAQPASAERRAALTRTGVLLGTPAYMAPEQLRHEHVDARADVFAFGVLMYEYACGVHPLRADRPIAIAGILGEVIARSMREVPAERFASAVEIVEALDRDSAPATSDRWWRTHQLVVAALYIAAAVLAWQIKEWHETPLTVALFLALGAASTVGAVLRGHLVFTESMNRARLASERQRTATAMWLVDLLAGAMTFVDGMLIAPVRALPAVLVFAVALGIVLAALVLEPATTAAVFGGEE